MVYLEHTNSRFWRCEVSASKTVEISYGKIGFAGRTMKKTGFGSKKEAEEYVSSQADTKREAGYIDATDQKSTKGKAVSGSKRKKVASTKQATKNAPPKKKAKVLAAKKVTPTETESSESESSDEEENELPAAVDVDPLASPYLKSGTIHKNYNVMLNQTNLFANNNKFYKIQLIRTTSGFRLLTRWGRVGETGKSQETGSMNEKQGVAEFAKKFKSKTSNVWKNRNKFKPQAGKYTIVEMEKDAKAAKKMSSCAKAMESSSSGPSKVLPCKLDKDTKNLVDLIFNEDMFKSAMAKLNIDPSKLPLGALSKAQIKRGFKALESIEEELDGRANHNTLMQLTSDFYTIIPHAFGRTRGPVLSTKASVEEKYEMLNTLTDIEAAQSMQKNNDNKETKQEEATPHPSDLNYEQLSCNLDLVGPKDSDRQIIEEYLANTQGGMGWCGKGMKLHNVWRVDRHNESDRFAKHSKLSNRRLLWHGTNVAVVAAILKSGLRIMPHSGGRVGRGIYLADQHEKSAWYVSASRGKVIMFLVEAALGKQYCIKNDDPSLTAAPTGFDSVLAMGRRAPSGKDDVELEIDGNTVKVPQAKPSDVESANNSSFQHNEFLIYRESQHRIRYVLEFDA